MSQTVQKVDLDLAVYGRRQVEYTVEGKGPVDFTSVVNAVTLQQVTAFESEVAAYTEVVNKRKEKLEKVGEALAVLQSVVGRFRVKNAESGDRVSDSRISSVETTFKTYGMDIQGVKGDSIDRKGANLAVQEAEGEIDIENAELDEVTTVMQGVITKRNNAYSTCTQLQRKTANTANTLIKGFSI